MTRLYIGLYIATMSYYKGSDVLRGVSTYIYIYVGAVARGCVSAGRMAAETAPRVFAGIKVSGALLAHSSPSGPFKGPSGSTALDCLS
jgi:hypothetical protein